LKFLILGPTVDEFSDASKIGISSGAALNYRPSSAGIGATYRVTSANMVGTRREFSKGVDTVTLGAMMNYSDEQRVAAKGISNGIVSSSSNLVANKEDEGRGGSSPDSHSSANSSDGKGRSQRSS
jgi:hypothetical protein